jgi:hypothetical protein
MHPAPHRVQKREVGGTRAKHTWTKQIAWIGTIATVTIGRCICVKGCWAIQSGCCNQNYSLKPTSLLKKLFVNDGVTMKKIPRRGNIVLIA